MMKINLKLIVMKSIVVIVTLASIGNTGMITTIASENEYEKNIRCLVEAGYKKETAEALEDTMIVEIVNALRENSELVDISTSSMEVDFLVKWKNCVVIQMKNWLNRELI